MTTAPSLHADSSPCDRRSCNVASYLPQMAGSNPDRSAVIVTADRRGPGRASCQSWDYSELEQASNCCANALAQGGINRGARVLVMVRPGYEFIYLTFALFKMGAVPILIDPGMGVGRMLDCIRMVEPEAFVGIPLAQLVRRVRPAAFRSVRHTITVGRGLPFGGSTLEHLMRKVSSEFSSADTASDETAAILFTSGSTGPAKGVVYEHGMFNAQVRQIQSHYGIESGEVDMPTFPLFALFSVAMCMTCVVPDMNPSLPGKARPERIVAAIQDHRVTNSFGSPALWRRVADYCMTNSVCLSSLRRVLIAGAPVRSELIEDVRRILGEGADVHTPYGATESLPVCSISGSELVGACAERSRRGAGICVGRELPGMSVRLIGITDAAIENWSNELEVPDGQRGEIVVSGEVVTKAYHGQPQATRVAKIAEHEQIVHRMGDLGYRDAEGRLWFCGRKTHRVITADQTLMSVCCEAIFNQHPRVARTALVGVGASGSQIPVIVVEPIDGKCPRKRAAATLRDELRSLAATNDQTHEIRTFLFHPSLPVDIRHNAKVNREQLTTWAQREAGMKVLVTGGGGFLGSHVASLFAQRRDDVAVLGRRVYPDAEAAGMVSIQADVRDRDAVSKACMRMDVVIHTAGVPGIWGKRKTFWDINYEGTRNVIDGCRENGVGRLVHTSSPSVVFGVEPVCGINESQPYPERFLGDYSASKAAAEQAVLAANGPELATIALRPHLIWGPGDPHLVPRVVARARAGQLRQVGDGTNLVDITYIDNAAHAHVLAADKLVPGSTCAGSAYFISQGEPVNLWSWIGEILAAYGVSWSPRPVSFPTAYRVGAVLEAAYRVMGLCREPRMTRFLATQLGHSHYLDISAARRELGYEPLISTREGMRRLLGVGSGSENMATARANAAAT